MTDTHPDIEAHLRALYRARTPAERVAMATALYTSAKELARAGIRMQAGDISEREMRRRLFLRFYPDDFPEPQRAAILRAVIGER